MHHTHTHRPRLPRPAQAGSVGRARPSKREALRRAAPTIGNSSDRQLHRFCFVVVVVVVRHPPPLRQGIQLRQASCSGRTRSRLSGCEVGAPCSTSRAPGGGPLWLREAQPRRPTHIQWARIRAPPVNRRASTPGPGKREAEQDQARTRSAGRLLVRGARPQGTPMSVANMQEGYKSPLGRRPKGGSSIRVSQLFAGCIVRYCCPPTKLAAHARPPWRATPVKRREPADRKSAPAPLPEVTPHTPPFPGAAR